MFDGVGGHFPFLKSLHANHNTWYMGAKMNDPIISGPYISFQKPEHYNLCTQSAHMAYLPVARREFVSVYNVYAYKQSYNSLGYRSK